MGELLTPAMFAFGLPVVLSPTEMIEVSALCSEREALGDWQSVAALRALLDGGKPVRNVFHFADGGHLPSPDGFLSFFQRRAEVSKVHAAVNALLFPRPDVTLFTALSSELRVQCLEEALSKIQKGGSFIRVLKALPLLTEEREKQTVTVSLRRMAFEGQSSREQAEEAASLLLYWVQNYCAVQEQVEDLLQNTLPEGARESDRILAAQYHRFLGGTGVLSLAHSAFDIENGNYDLNFDFPWVHPGLVRYLVASLFDGMPPERVDEVLMNMAHAYLKCLRADMDLQINNALPVIEKIFLSLPNRHFAKVMYGLSQILGEELARVSTESAKTAAIERNFFKLMTRLMHRLPEHVRMTVLEQIYAKVHPLNVSARYQFVQDTVVHLLPSLVSESSKRRWLVLMWKLQNGLLRTSPHRFARYPAGVITMRELAQSLSEEESDALWGQLILEADTTEDINKIVLDITQSFGIRFTPGLMTIFDKRLRAQREISRTDFQLFDSLGLPGLLVQGKVDLTTLSPRTRLFCFLSQNRLQPDMYKNPVVTEFLFSREDPDLFAEERYNQIRKSFGHVEANEDDLRPTVNLLFMVSLLLDAEKNGIAALRVLAFHFKTLVSHEEARRKIKTPQHVSQEQRVWWVRKIIETAERWNVLGAADFFECLPSFMNWLTPNIRKGLEEARGIVGELMTFYDSGLPPTVAFYWKWKKAPDRRAFGQSVGGLLKHYREGGPLPPSPKEEDLLFAHAALDAPRAIPLEEFRYAMQKPGEPPAIFLDRAFSLEIASEELSGAIHHQVDKGFLRKGWEKIPNALSPKGLADYLGTVLQNPRQYGLSPVRQKMDLALEGKSVSEESAPEMAQILLKILSESEDDAFRDRNQVQEVMTKLVLGLTWIRPEAEGLRKSVAEFQRAVPSDQLHILVRQLETVYQDTVMEVLRPYPNLRSKEIEKYRAQLKKQRAKIAVETGDGESVMVWPWASQTAVYFGSVAGDCTRGRERAALYPLPMVRRDPFQVNILESHHQIVGLLYLQKSVLDGKRVLVVAIQPRSLWKISRKELLDKVVGAFSQIAEEEGYDRLLFSAYGQVTNDADLTTAIKAKAYPVWNTMRPLVGDILNGNHFEVVWNRYPGGKNG
ncbi:MAG: hypothetical protein Q7T03_06195 [Deltaproteobacteria bacterium]|nr:hypothetical protein [Deltaproteobacteria bacterium]